MYVCIYIYIYISTTNQPGTDKMLVHAGKSKQETNVCCKDMLVKRTHKHKTDMVVIFQSGQGGMPNLGAGHTIEFPSERVRSIHKNMHTCIHLHIIMSYQDLFHEFSLWVLYACHADANELSWSVKVYAHVRMRVYAHDVHIYIHKYIHPYMPRRAYHNALSWSCSSWRILWDLSTNFVLSHALTRMATARCLDVLWATWLFWIRWLSDLRWALMTLVHAHAKALSACFAFVDVGERARDELP